MNGEKKSLEIDSELTFAKKNRTDGMEKNDRIDGSEILRGVPGPDGAAFRYCECTSCKEVSRCTPSNDFYTVPDDPDAHLCSCCFQTYYGRVMAKNHVASSEKIGGTPLLGRVAGVLSKLNKLSKKWM